jgi:hypothetical protein
VVAAHVPALHACPLGHALLQRPQCAGLVCVFAQTPPQSTSGAVQVGPDMVKVALQKPDTLRHQVYQHYNVASPKWDVSTTVSEASMNRR